MRKEILHELYKYKDDYVLHDVGHMLQRLIGKGNELIVGETLSQMTATYLIELKAEHYKFPVSINQNSIGGRHAGEDIQLKDFSINARILFNGIKEVENDMLIASTDATNKSLQQTNSSVMELNESTKIYYQKTRNLTVVYLWLVGFTGIFILGQFIFSIVQWKSENSTKKEL